jgi:sporulation protein YunB
MGGVRVRKRSGFAKILTGLAVMLLVVVAVDLRIRPVVEKQIEYVARQYSFQLINQAMLSELVGELVPYGEIVSISRDGDGMVTSIETDMRAVNLLQTRTADTVARRLGQREWQTISVPVGTLLGSPLTAGRGFAVEIRIIPLGTVQSELGNQFAEAGINQTLHQIMLTTTVQIAAVLPGFTVETETAAGYCVAETVIVGAVPDGFTLVNGDEGGTVERINDYGVDVSE